MWQNILASSIVLIAFIIIIILIYAVVSYRNVNKQKKVYKDIHLTLEIGQKVVLANGIYGKIKAVNSETVDLQVKSGAVMEVSRFSISKIIK